MLRGSKDSARDLYFALIKEQLDTIKIPTSCPWRWAEASAHFTFPSRIRRDGDNYVPRMKPIWDALRHWGILADDDVDSIGWPQYTHSYQTGISRTTITLAESPSPRLFELNEEGRT